MDECFTHLPNRTYENFWDPWRATAYGRKVKNRPRCLQRPEGRTHFVVHAAANTWRSFVRCVCVCVCVYVCVCVCVRACGLAGLRARARAACEHGLADAVN